MIKTNLSGNVLNKKTWAKLTLVSCFHTSSVILSLALLCSTYTATAVGFRLPNQDPEGIARGNAFVATADNPSAIYYNPAGITQLEGNNLSAGLYMISTGATYNSPAGSAGTKKDFKPVPQFYYTFTPKEYPLSFGVGVYVPYGLALSYDNEGPFRNVAQNGSLLYATVNPVIAWKITKELSIAVGPTINYSKAEFNQGILGTPDQFHFVGDDYTFGFNAGVRWQPLEQLAFGLKYHYQTDMSYKGHSTVSGFAMPFLNGTQPTTAFIHFPQFAAAGVSYRPTDKWNIEVDIDWTDWDSVNQITFDGNGLGGPLPPKPLNYRSSFMYEVGATRQLGKGYFASLGYIYSENSSPDANYSPLIPDSDLHLFSVGVGHKGKRWGWALSYTAAVSPGRNVSGSSYDLQPAPGYAVNGHYDTVNHALNGSISLKF